MNEPIKVFLKQCDLNVHTVLLLAVFMCSANFADISTTTYINIFFVYSLNDNKNNNRDIKNCVKSYSPN